MTWERFDRPTRPRAAQKGSRSKLEDQAAEIVTAYREGATASALARDRHVTPQTILNLLRRHGVEVRRAWKVR